MTTIDTITRRNVLTAGPTTAAVAVPIIALNASESPLDRARWLTDELSAALAELDGEWMAIVYPAHRKAMLSQARPWDEPIMPG